MVSASGEKAGFQSHPELSRQVIESNKQPAVSGRSFACRRAILVSPETTEGSFASHCKPRSLKSEYQTRRRYDESTRNVAVSPPRPSPEIDRKQPNATLCNTQSGLSNAPAKVRVLRDGQLGIAHYHRTKPNVREFTAERAVTLLLWQVTCPSRPPMRVISSSLF